MSHASQTEMRFASRSKERGEKLATVPMHDLTTVESPRRIAARAARLGVSASRAMELMEPGAISLDPAELSFERVLRIDSEIPIYGLPAQSGEGRLCRTMDEIVTRTGIT